MSTVDTSHQGPSQLFSPPVHSHPPLPARSLLHVCASLASHPQPSPPPTPPPLPASPPHATLPANAEPLGWPWGRKRAQREHLGTVPTTGFSSALSTPPPPPDSPNNLAPRDPRVCPWDPDTLLLRPSSQSPPSVALAPNSPSFVTRPPHARLLPLPRALAAQTPAGLTLFHQLWLAVAWPPPPPHAVLLSLTQRWAPGFPHSCASTAHGRPSAHTCPRGQAHPGLPHLGLVTA